MIGIVYCLMHCICGDKADIKDQGEESNNNDTRRGVRDQMMWFHFFLLSIYNSIAILNQTHWLKETQLRKFKAKGKSEVSKTTV